MPEGGANRRGEQLELLNRFQHRTFSSKGFLDQVWALSESSAGSEEERAQIKALKRTVALQSALSEELSAQVSKVSVASWSAWKTAKAEKNFALALPHLSELIRLQKEIVSGYRAHPYLKPLYTGKTDYEVLFDTYEPGFSAAQLQELLGKLARAIAERLPELEKKYGKGDARISLPVPEQVEICRKVAEELGLSRNLSRLDVSAHPFSTNVYSDLRITTRYQESDALDALMSTIHETGHSLYEAGIPERLLMTPCGQAVSLGVHESQSRFWENFIGRSDGFIRYLAKAFSFDEAKTRTGLRSVKRSFVRVDADEVSYHLHVYLRMELEEALVSGKLAPKDLPAAWNARFKELFGLEVPDDSLGCLQDIHWYHGSFGYFPTYSLGTIFAAELFQDMQAEVPDWEGKAAQGEFAGTLQFLRKRVHERAALSDSPGVMRGAIGRELGVGAFLKYCNERYPT